MKATLTIGCSASGKSSWAQVQQKRDDRLYVIERDAIREMIFKNKVAHNEPFTWKAWKWKWEKDVNEVVTKMIDLAAEDRSDIIISDTNLNPNHRAALIDRLVKLGYEIHLKMFPLSFFEAVSRDIGRPDAVGPWVIGQQVARYQEQFGEGRAPEYDPELPDVVLCDIDGTVAIMKDRSPYEWDKVKQDLPNEITFAMLRGLVDSGKGVPFFLSGRDGVCYDDTMDWLLEHACEWIPHVPFDLQMRSAGDTRPDTIVKRELFDIHIRGKYNVTVVLDDRPKVAQMWRELGLNVVQIGNPYIDF